MTEQDNWKEILAQYCWMKPTDSEDANRISDNAIKLVESLLSSQAHALKERMLSDVNDLCRPSQFSESWQDGFIYAVNRVKETLSAIESIEI